MEDLTSNKFLYLKIIGYADTTGSETYNEKLSEKRAIEVYKLISSKTKLNKDKLYLTWIGESGQEVAYDLHFEKAHIQKRCVDVWIIRKK
jgi:outer membrane protein OmpA-like peptidoglycan-associated protein